MDGTRETKQKCLQMYCFAVDSLRLALFWRGTEELIWGEKGGREDCEDRREGKLRFTCVEKNERKEKGNKTNTTVFPSHSHTCWVQYFVLLARMGASSDNRLQRLCTITTATAVLAFLFGYLRQQADVSWFFFFVSTEKKQLCISVALWLTLLSDRTQVIYWKGSSV